MKFCYPVCLEICYLRVLAVCLITSILLSSACALIHNVTTRRRRQQKAFIRGIRCSLGFQIINLARPPESRESPTLTFNLVRHWPEQSFLNCFIAPPPPKKKKNLTHSDVLSAPFEAFVQTNLLFLHFCCKYLKGSLG